MTLPKKIVDIQEKREQDSLKSFVDKKNIYDRLKDEHDKAVSELDSFKLWRKQETERVFLELRANPLPKKELDKKKQELAELKFKELAMLDGEMKMALEVKNAEKIKEQAQQAYTASRIKKNKYEDVYSTEKHRLLAKQNLKEENDLDEEMVLKFTHEKLSWT